MSNMETLFDVITSHKVTIGSKVVIDVRESSTDLFNTEDRDVEYVEIEILDTCSFEDNNEDTIYLLKFRIITGELAGKIEWGSLGSSEQNWSDFDDVYYIKTTESSQAPKQIFS